MNAQELIGWIEGYIAGAGDNCLGYDVCHDIQNKIDEYKANQNTINNEILCILKRWDACGIEVTK